MPNFEPEIKKLRNMEKFTLMTLPYAQDALELVISQEANAANPIQKGLKPLLTFDVWEHAYYLDFQNRRADHLAALWQIIDWKVIEKRYNQ